MAFKSIVNGAECSGSNPLRQLTKAFAEDKSLQRDAFVSGAGRQHEAPSKRRAFSGPEQMQSMEDQALVDQFFSSQQRNPQLSSNSAFQFGDMRGNLENMMLDPRAQAKGLSHNDWTTEFDSARIYELPPKDEVWDKVFEMADMEAKMKSPDAHEWRADFMAAADIAARAHPAEFEEAFGRNFNWEEQFALAEHSSQPTLRQEGMGKLLNDEAWEQEFTRARLQEEGSGTLGNGEENLENGGYSDFESIWNDIQKNRTDIDELDTWEADFHNEGGYNEGIENTSGEYTFETVNPFLDHPNPMEEGIRLMNGAGTLSQAALAFEAACQSDPQNSAAWAKLGSTQAENEKEEAAIRALEKAVAVNSQNLEARMALAISYVNEGYDHKAYHSLERWLAVRYPDVIADMESDPPTLEYSGVPSYDKHLRVKELFLRAARRSDTMNRQLDPDVQIGLGVLFYGSGEFDKAVDCFVAALEDKPTDYILFNRLGATLANSGRSEEAIDAYHHALEIKPSFVRARYNLGVSCINIGVHKEAAEHFLAALSMHQEGKGPGEVNVSDNLWDTLRRTFVMMERRDLADKVVAGMDVSEFQGEFDF